MTAMVIAAIHQHLADALVAHLAEGDYGDGRHLWPLRCVIVLPALKPLALHQLLRAMLVRERQPCRLELPPGPARSVAPGNYSDDFAIFWTMHCPPELFKLPQNWAASSVVPKGPTMVR